MKRTPQHGMAQSRLTVNGGNLGLNTNQGPAAQGEGMETPASQPPAGSTPVAPVLGNQPGEPLTAEFFRNLIGENTRMITGKIDKLTTDLLTLTSTVESNRAEIAKSAVATERQGALLEAQRTELARMDERLARLEAGGPVSTPANCPDGNRGKSHAYLKARRSVRIWPVNRQDEDSLWKGTGEFIHEALKIPECDVSQEDIESVVAVPDPRFPGSNVNNEALVTFFCPRKRDVLLSNSPHLSSFVDGAGRPTAGIRLEIPAELDDTFRLLSRFGTRLRARHGEGTKRHIKFDDTDASLFINVKLPGDDMWSRVSPAMAKADLTQTTREESARLMKRISAGNGQGPRQRLAAPAPTPGQRPRTSGGAPPASAQDAAGTATGRQGDPSSMQSTSRNARAWAPPRGAGGS